MNAVPPRERYARQLILPGWGDEAQERLARGRVLVVGAGGLGSPALTYLAAAGVGTLGIVDPDRVEISNLQRQVIYASADLGLLKCRAAARRIKALNPGIAVGEHPLALTAENADELISGYDVVVDCTDSLSVRFVINDACLRLNRPWVHGAISEFYGQATTFIPGRGPCLRCLYPEGDTPAALPRGVMGPVVGLIGTMQAGEVMKLLTGLGRPLAGRMLVWEALPARFTEFTLRRDPSCPACGLISSMT
ncbi:MAG: HesA/MoeB/ThiF family protein [Thermoanaerobacterales bacterium]|nr:HesA/MoeB/ThiF family protein [Thermoanaerobacterales bacterium]